MPTISEDWHARKERQDAMVTAFLEAKPGTIDYSQDVLRARLIGLGLRGDYLHSEVKQAVARRATLTKNWNCDNNRCHDPHGEVRVYPIGGDGNAILCQACWAHENRYRFGRGVVTRNPENFPQVDWSKAEVYKKAGE